MIYCYIILHINILFYCFYIKNDVFSSGIRRNAQYFLVRRMALLLAAGQGNNGKNCVPLVKKRDQYNFIHCIRY